MTLTEEQEKAQPLLEKFGIIIAPDVIDHDAYIELSWSLKIGRDICRDKPLELRCCGSGGHSTRSFAIYDLLQQDGNVDGIAIGRVSSGHSVVFCGCNQRFIYPNAIVSVHQTRQGNWISNYEQRDFELAHEHHKWSNDLLIDVYASTSNQDKDYWRDQLFNTGMELLDIDAIELVALGMARPISERG